MDIERLEATARALVAPGKGILAMDESLGTIGKRLQSVGVENTLENRTAYRTLLLGTPELGEHIGGAILFEETLRGTSSDGTPFPDLARRQGILIGIKVDKGAKALAGHEGEKVTEGLDGLRERLAEHANFGAEFCKWRAVIAIGPDLPSRACIAANAHALARYAALCQEAGMVPVVEPEVLLDGDHTIERCLAVTLETQRCVFEALYRQGVAFSGMVLKPSMVLPGAQCPRRASVESVADLTLRCLGQAVPAEVPGIAFLSGGQSDRDASAHLDAINRMARDRPAPWRLTFSYARALQQSAMEAWHGDPARLDAAREILLHRARLNSRASMGEYSSELENQVG